MSRIMHWNVEVEIDLPPEPTFKPNGVREYTATRGVIVYGSSGSANVVLRYTSGDSDTSIVLTAYNHWPGWLREAVEAHRPTVALEALS